jgi:DNA-binding NarL/FixJ family response regulator
MTPIRVMIVDDEELVRQGLRLILDEEDGIEVVADAADGWRALEAARLWHPDVVLMDIRMPGLDGLEATHRLLAEHAAMRVVVLTTFDTDEHITNALRAGASGFLLKGASAEQLAEAVRVVASGEALLAPSVTRRLVERFLLSHPPPPPGTKPQLTDREADVLALLVRGASNAEIASALHLGTSTIKTHVSNLLMKLEARDRIQAIIRANEMGMVEPEAR